LVSAGQEYHIQKKKKIQLVFGELELPETIHLRWVDALEFPARIQKKPIFKKSHRGANKPWHSGYVYYILEGDHAH